MEIIDILYLIFIFITLYFTLLFLMIFFQKRDDLFVEEIGRRRPIISILIPAYNEESTIYNTIKAVKALDYPKNKLEIIVINDGSSDKTGKIAAGIKGVKVINKRNSGKADSINYALRRAKGDIVVIIDADSYPQKDSLLRMLSYFEDPKVAGVTATILPKEAKNILQRLQCIEYRIIVWVRKILQYIDGVYVTPGPLSMYRRKLLLKVGGFDKENMTEDIEIAWRLMYNKYKIRMSLASKTVTDTPSKLRTWWRQRVRWSTGGIQTILKYSNVLFKKKYGSLGKFIAPFFLLSLITSLTGFAVVVYLLVTQVLTRIYFTIKARTLDITLERIADSFLLPNTFTFFAIILFISSLIYLRYGIRTLDKDFEFFKIRNIFDILIYLTLYITIFPIILIQAIYRVIFGVKTW